MITPRPYLSFSAMSLFEQDQDKYVKQYLYGEKQFVTRNMKYGSKMADGLEKDEFTGDPVLDTMIIKLPKYELMDKIVEAKGGVKVRYPVDDQIYTVPALKDEKGLIPLLAKPDSSTAEYDAFYEYKTSVKKWTQKMSDESGQITFYATAIWLATGKIPQSIELVNVQVAYQSDRSLAPTGEMFRFPTKRTMTDIIKMTARIRKNWSGIKKLCERELL